MSTLVWVLKSWKNLKKLHVTERCVKDNVQIYVGSSLLDWICEEQNSFNDWVKLGSNQFGVYFEGLVLYEKTVKIKFFSFIFFQ